MNSRLRNKPCLCGSGEKYKKCCELKEDNSPPESELCSCCNHSPCNTCNLPRKAVSECKIEDACDFVSGNDSKMKLEFMKGYQQMADLGMNLTVLICEDCQELSIIQEPVFEFH